MIIDKSLLDSISAKGTIKVKFFDDDKNITTS